MPNETISREEFRELRTYAQSTNHAKNNLEIKVEGLRVELANAKEDDADLWSAVNDLRDALVSIRTTVAGIVALSAILQTVIVSFIVYKITH